jgi:hypothetical protein
MSARRIVLIVLIATTLGACGGGGLSDAEMAWCPSHAREVANAAEDLHLPPPSTGDGSWQRWADYVDSGVLGNGWTSMTLVAERPNRDRACKAAFAAR